MGSLISFRLRLAVIVTLAMAALPCFAGEVAVLRNGFSIRHERREVVGDLPGLYVSADGSSFVDVPTAEIEHFEDAPPELPRQLPTPGFAASGAKRVSSPFARNAPNVGRAESGRSRQFGEWALPAGSRPGQQRDQGGERIQCARRVSEGSARTDAVDARHGIDAGCSQCFRSHRRMSRAERNICGNCWSATTSIW